MTDADRKDTLQRITTSTDVNAFAKADIVIEVCQKGRGLNRYPNIFKYIIIKCSLIGSERESTT